MRVSGLKPCPACNGTNTQHGGDIPIPGEGEEFWIICLDDCGLIGPTRDSYQEAEAAWNAMPRHSDHVGLLEKVEHAIAFNTSGAYDVALPLLEEIRAVLVKAGSTKFTATETGVGA